VAGESTSRKAGVSPSALIVCAVVVVAGGLLWWWLKQPVQFTQGPPITPEATPEMKTPSNYANRQCQKAACVALSGRVCLAARTVFSFYCFR
jgi:cytoskeletal protein RodZ